MYILKLIYILLPSLISHQHLQKKQNKTEQKNVCKEREYICKFNFPGEKQAFQSNFDMFFLLCVTCSLSFVHIFAFTFSW